MSASGQFSIASVLRRSGEIMRDEGPRRFWFKLLGETCYRRMLVIENVMQAEVQNRPVSSFQCQQMGKDDIDEYLEFRDYTDRDTLSGRLDDGHVCFLVREHGSIIHTCWVATGDTTIDYLKCRIRLADDAVYVYEVFTAVPMRGNAISAARSQFMEPLLYEQGYRRLLAVIWPENTPVVRSAEKSGYSIIGRMGYRGFGSRRSYFCNIEAESYPLKILGPM